jgi:hypothetical protein
MESKESVDSQLGLVAMVDISGIGNGAHKVKVQSKQLDDPKYREIRANTIEEVSIGFWKDVH